MLAERAARLAERLGLPLVALDAPDFKLQLVVTARRLELREVGQQTGPVYVDFVGGRLASRRRGGLARDPLVRAVGRKGTDWSVLDVTAGLGRDAFLLAWAGCRVTMVERSPVIAALLEDGLARGLADPDVAPVIRDRLNLVQADARGYLAALPEADRPDAVYIDPMFEPRAKTAASKKEMRLCRLVAGDDPDAADLLVAARQVARYRVAVKRWLHAPPLGPAPDIQYKGQSIRYDVYLT
ncbi:MAG TPA: class I SAM-dependent methyltransferase [Phycisphaerae bacterium]|nr:class I SAM-dependent methyltransferase [Phycisphaerae bacterium]HOM52427.1 class I SAM-dependent methyltransferase [Phycisphaerae bacterium]HON67424.1 class I SAM-dependent methyltransferase [Phycisphaerae bacterium]HPP27701.1 class I SAM-dependent methyltransferase [Phycisphaerae bacterium]HPZ98000.1 class I SAM-dependent methyltransferase [Phycisphaerae bacterium]